MRRANIDIDFSKTASDYRKHRAGFPPELICRLREFEVGLSAQRLLDLGTGTGTLARQFALEGCDVIGLDPALALLEQARLLDSEVGARVEYIVAKAEETGLASQSMDVITAGQCWHWFDRPKAGAEAFRLLRCGGTLVIAHLDWLPLPGNVVEATEILITRYNPAWHLGGGTGVYPAWFVDMAVAGFTGIESFSFDITIPYTHEGWRGRIRASAGVAASLPSAQVQSFDAELASLLDRRFPKDVVDVPHRVFAVLGRKSI